MSSTIIAGFVIAALSAGLAVTDYMFVEAPRIEAPEAPEQPDIPSSTSSSAASSAPGDIVTGTSSSRAVVKKGVSTKKMTGVDVSDVFARLQLVARPTQEASFLQFLSQNQGTVQTVVLLRNNDRAFLFSWLEHSDVKAIFSNLKQALQEQFSAQVTDLVDETRMQDGVPPVDILSFLDPALSEEKILFLRVRNRLYELRIAENGQEMADALVAELSR